MRWGGLEPPRLSAPPPQDGVSTNFTTSAATCVLLLPASSGVSPRDVRTSRRVPDQRTGPTGLEPATSRVTVECSNQTELRPLNDRCQVSALGCLRDTVGSP